MVNYRAFRNCGDDLVAAGFRRQHRLYRKLIADTGGKVNELKTFTSSSGYVYCEDIYESICRGITEQVPTVHLSVFSDAWEMALAAQSRQVPLWVSIGPAAWAEADRTGMFPQVGAVLGQRHPGFAEMFRKIGVSPYLPRILGGAGLVPTKDLRNLRLKDVARKADILAIASCLYVIRLPDLESVWTCSTDPYFRQACDLFTREYFEEVITGDLRYVHSWPGGRLPLPFNFSGWISKMRTLLSVRLSLADKRSKETKVFKPNLKRFGRDFRRIRQALANRRPPDGLWQPLKDLPVLTVVAMMKELKTFELPFVEEVDFGPWSSIFTVGGLSKPPDIEYWRQLCLEKDVVSLILRLTNGEPTVSSEKALAPSPSKWVDAVGIGSVL
jgi:hypothetical protein